MLPLQWEVRGILGATSGRLIQPVFSLLCRTLMWHCQTRCLLIPRSSPYAIHLSSAELAQLEKRAGKYLESLKVTTVFQGRMVPTIGGHLLFERPAEPLSRRLDSGRQVRGIGRRRILDPVDSRRWRGVASWWKSAVGQRTRAAATNSRRMARKREATAMESPIGDKRESAHWKPCQLVPAQLPANASREPPHPIESQPKQEM